MNTKETKERMMTGSDRNENIHSQGQYMGDKDNLKLNVRGLHENQGAEFLPKNNITDTQQSLTLMSS